MIKTWASCAESDSGDLEIPEMEWSLLVLKPDSRHTDIQRILRGVLEKRRIRIVRVWDVEIDLSKLLSMWPLDTHDCAISFLILYHGMVGKTATAVLCSGPDAIKNCIEAKDEVRAKTADFIYANAVHCADTAGEAVAQCEALSRPSVLNLDLARLLPVAWHGWSQADLLEAMASVSVTVESFGWRKRTTWSPFEVKTGCIERIRASDVYEGWFDKLVLLLARCLQIDDIETAIRGALSSLYDPLGLAIPPTQVVSREYFRAITEADESFVENLIVAER